MPTALPEPLESHAHEASQRGDQALALLSDLVNEPPHYQGVSGIECIDAIESMGCGVEFCRANAVKYLWRLGKKGDALQDAQKAQWYVDRLVKQLSPTPATTKG